MDEIIIEVLDDGSIKVTTDKVGPANHMSADKLLSFIDELAGGAVQRQKRQGTHTHAHTQHHDLNQ
jgi:hypothetical protein